MQNEEDIKDLDITYEGGNNGYCFAQFLSFNDLLKDNEFCDYYCNIATKIDYTERNFPNWIKNDDFWEDFIYACENDFNIIMSY